MKLCIEIFAKAHTLFYNIRTQTNDLSRWIVHNMKSTVLTIVVQPKCNMIYDLINFWLLKIYNSHIWLKFSIKIVIFGSILYHVSTVETFFTPSMNKSFEKKKIMTHAMFDKIELSLYLLGYENMRI